MKYLRALIGPAIALSVFFGLHAWTMHVYHTGLRDGCEVEVMVEFTEQYMLGADEKLPPDTVKMLQEAAVKVCAKVLK